MPQSDGVIRRAYLVRHGECYDNRSGLIAREDAELTPEGVRQSKAIGRVFAGSGMPVVRGVLPRVVQTASYIPLVAFGEPLLDEVNLGEWHGKPARDFDVCDWLDGSMHCEQPVSVARRAGGVICDRTEHGDTIFVTHAALIGLGAVNLLGWDVECFAGLVIPCGSITVLETDGDTWRLVGLGLKP